MTNPFSDLGVRFKKMKTVTKCLANGHQAERKAELQLNDLAYRDLDIFGMLAITFRLSLYARPTGCSRPSVVRSTYVPVLSRRKSLTRVVFTRMRWRAT